MNKLIASIRLRRALNNLRRSCDLDERGPQILDLLTTNRGFILFPKLFHSIIRKAWRLIGSQNYMDIIQAMAEKYEATSNKPVKGPLKYILPQLDVDSKADCLLEYQETFLELIQILIRLDDSPVSRTKLLGVLIKNAKYITKRRQCLEWTIQLRHTVSILLDGGANPNATDEESMTPYSWILVGKERSEGSNPEAFRTLSDVEQIFLNLLRKTISNLEQKSDIGDRRLIILQMLTEKDVLKADPTVFHLMVERAHKLIGSDYYLDVIKSMAEIYRELSNKPEEGPLNCLVQQFKDKNKAKHLYGYQETLIKVIQILISTDDSPVSRGSAQADVSR